jgi:hypothetical protein
VRHPRRDVEGDRDVGDGGAPGEAERVVEENLVRPGLDDQVRQAGQVGEQRTDQREGGVLARCVVRDAGGEELPAEQPPWKYSTTLTGSMPATVIWAVGTPPSTAEVTVTSAGGGDANFRSSSRCSLTLLSIGKAACRRPASRFSRCSALTVNLPSGAVGQMAQTADKESARFHRRRHAGEMSSLDRSD